MNMKVCEGLEVINIDGHYLETLKKTSNNIDTGASCILDGLSLFAEQELAKYDYEPTVPYDKLFFALKQIIESALENDSVRDAIMTGVINTTKDGIPVARQAKKPEPEVKIIYKEIKPRNKSAITKFAKTHTLKEVQEHFEFTSRNSVKEYMRRNKIEFVHSSAGRPSIQLPVDKVKTLAQSMRLCELVRTFGCTKRQMMYFCQKNNISYKGARNEKDE